MNLTHKSFHKTKAVLFFAILMALPVVLLAQSRHWAFRPLRQSPIPKVQGNWGRTPVDKFILAKLQSSGLKPSPPADKRTLLRRAYYDLIGLPPNPKEIQEFLSDTRPDAYERMIDRLLASPRYGERWGRHWLDVVHYGDTHGYDKDKRRPNAWHYRDYVIRAFNKDTPYARFVQEQVAGDLLFPEHPDGIVATGFVAAGPWDFVGHLELREGTVEKEKTRLIDRDDMLANTMSTFNSVTVHCAQCHDHKFDPIPQTDYYRLQTVFSAVDRGERSFPDSRRAGVLEKRRRLLNSLKELDAKGAKQNPSQLSRLDAEYENFQRTLAALPIPKVAESSPTNGYHSEISLQQDTVKWVQIDLGSEQSFDTIRLIPARPTDFPDTPGFGFPLQFSIAIASTSDFANPQIIADHTGKDSPNLGDVPFVVKQQMMRGRYVRVTASKLWKRTGDYVFALGEMQIESDGRNLAKSGLVSAKDSIEAGRWSRNYLIDNFTSRKGLLDTANPEIAQQERTRDKITLAVAENRQQRDSVLLKSLPKPQREQREGLLQQISILDKENASLPADPKVFALVPHAPRPIRFLKRGDVEQPGQIMAPGALSALPELKFGETKGIDNRAILAKWLTSPQNPLTWRSIVNRVWQYHFGKGIVETPNDFGLNGSTPSHPELLDWLAIKFQKEGGSLKRLHRLLMTSEVYRQSSANQISAAKTDSDNRLLWRMNRRRLEAEALRDSTLAISGELDLRMGGEGFEMFRYKDDHSPIYDHLAPERLQDASTRRRTVYAFTVRSVPNPFLECLDCADPNNNTPVRNTTLTALQALALMNDPFVLQQSAAFAKRLTKENESLEKQVESAFVYALARKPLPKERSQAVDYAQKYGLAKLCRLLINSNEFIFVD